jgi:hypothetical protein
MMTTILPDHRTPEQIATGERWARRHEADGRVRCNAMQFWRMCATPRCRRHRSCSGEPQACFERHWALFPEDLKEWVRGVIVASHAGATKEERVRAGEARRMAYLKMLEAKAAPAAEQAAMSDAATDQPAEVRIRRL